MRKLPERFIINAALSASFIILTLFAIYCYFLIKDLLNSTAWVNHTRVVIEEVKEVSLSLSNISRGIGNYLLSNNQEYIADLAEPNKQANESIKHLELLLKDNLKQEARLTRLRILMKEKSNIQKEIIEAQKNKDFAKANQLKNSKPLLETNKKINMLLTAMYSEELNLLKKRSATFEYYMQKSQMQLMLTFIFGEVFLLSSIILLNIHLTRKKRIEHQLIHAEKNLLANKEHYDFALRGSNTGLWHWDLESQIVFYSDECQRMLGYKLDELKKNENII